VYLYEDRPSRLVDQRDRNNFTGEKTMIKPRLIRSLVAIATIATLLCTTYRSSAAELNRLVITGIALDRLASQHSMAAYPPGCALATDSRRGPDSHPGGEWQDVKRDCKINQLDLSEFFRPLDTLALAIQALSEWRLLSANLI
jgi:hypothetical protein